MANQKTLVVLEPPIRKLLVNIARLNNISLSSLCRDLIREALEIYEDKYWNNIASKREKNFNWKKGLTHKEVWNKT
jgi:hypothetical protein